MAICLLMSPAGAMIEEDKDAVQRALRLDVMVPPGSSVFRTRNVDLESHFTRLLKDIPQNQRDDVEAKALSLWNKRMSGESLLNFVRILGGVQEADRSEVLKLTKSLLLPLPHREAAYCDLISSVACIPSDERDLVTSRARHYVEEMIPVDSRAVDNAYGNFLRSTYYPRFIRYITAVESFKREHFFQCLDQVFQRFTEFTERESITRELSACASMAARDQLMLSLQSRIPLRTGYGCPDTRTPPPGGWYVPGWMK